MDRALAINRILNGLDTDFIKAFCEPARLEVLKHLLILGPCDIKTLAEKMPQDRSVISRHLSVLHKSGILNHKKDGRHAIYSVDGEQTLAMSEALTETIRECLEQSCC